MILVLWKQYPALLVRIAGLKTIVSRNEQLTRKVYEGHDYRLLGFSSLQAGDEEAEGYRFSYSTEGVTQVMNSFLVKDGSTVYSFLCCGREENADADQETFRQILGSLDPQPLTDEEFAEYQKKERRKGTIISDIIDFILHFFV